MSRIFRRSVALPVLTFVVAATALAATASPAAADNANTLTVVGTSDVFDSNLVQAVIKPGFENAFPGVTLNYISKGTGAAIAYAETGAASAMIVHAASLENQYVDQGYSLENYGRAIFWGDYVLLGPANDPANVMNGASHDIATAFERVALAGKQGKANFVSRGGTPGTTVQEHAIWSLTNGVPTCDVTDVNGGGKAPSTVPGTCPVNPANPSWYHTTGLTQGPNIINGDACNYTGGGCYVFTDRGTFQYLKSQGSIANLQILVRNNLASKRGGGNVLVNSFHAYGVNPDKFAGNPNVSINSTGALNFLNWITSPPAQSAIGAYLASDPAGAPFIPDASPVITASKLPASVAPGKSVVVTGSIKNVVPGAPPLADQPVTLHFTPTDPGGPPADVTTSTDANGQFNLAYRPLINGRYTVQTPQLTQLEDGSLNPTFSDLLAPASSLLPGTVGVAATVTVKNVAAGPASTHVITGSVVLRPVDQVNPGSLDLYAALASDPGAPLVKKGSVPIPVGTTNLPFRYRLGVGTWNIALHYSNPGVVIEGVSATTTVTVT